MATERSLRILGELADNVALARAGCRWAVLHGYAQYVSHRFYTQPGILDEDVPSERRRGIKARSFATS